MRSLPAVLALCCLLAAACGGRQPAAPVEEAVVNEALGLRLAPLPSDFEVAVNRQSDLELAPAADGVEGRVTFLVGEEETGINLVAAVKRHQQWIEEQPEASYQGGQELMTPHGTAFYSRGRFLLGLDPIEETVVLLKHPTQSRLLTIRYRYPAAADSSVRVQQLLDLVGALEGLPTGTEQPQPSGPSDEASD